MLVLNNCRMVVYGKRLTCPPYSPTPSETRKVIAWYRRAILLKFRSCQGYGDQPAINIHKFIAEMQREVFLSGYYAGNITYQFELVQPLVRG
jgi:predicted metal-binding protein